MKPLFWVGQSRKDFLAFPEEVHDAVGYALHKAQIGDKHPSAKPLKGFAGAGVLEVVEDHDGDTYRAVYTVRFEGAVYVLHAFQKKAKKGIATPKQEIELIKASRGKVGTGFPQIAMRQQRLRAGCAIQISCGLL